MQRRFMALAVLIGALLPLHARQQGSFKVSGQITSTVPSASYATRNPSSGAAVPVNAVPILYLVQRDTSGNVVRTTQTRISNPPDAKGNWPFELAAASTGTYDLFASLPDLNGWGPAAMPGQAQQPVTFGRTSIDVRGDLTGVTIAVHPGVDVKGRVTLDGRPASVLGLQILLQPDARAAAIQPYQMIGRTMASIGSDGTFSWPAVLEAQYQVHVGSNVTTNLTLADILQDGKSVKEKGIAIGAVPPGSIEIVLKSGGGPALNPITVLPTNVQNNVQNNPAIQLQAQRGIQTVSLASAPAGPPRGDGGPARDAEIRRVLAIAVDANANLFILDGSYVRKVGSDGIIRAIAGNGSQGYKGDGGPAAAAGFEYPADIAVDASGNLFIADNLGHRIRKVSAAGVISTVAGTGESGNSGDGGAASVAKLRSPRRIALDAAGNLLIADSGNARIRKVSTAGVISTIAGTGKAGFSGDGGPATAAQIDTIAGLGVDAAGNVYIADSGNARIRKITARGVISTIAGTGKTGFTGDGGPAAAAEIDPVNLAVDTAGNVFIVEINRIRNVGTDGVIRTVAGSGEPGFSGDGSLAAKAQLRGPSDVTVDAKGNLYIADALNGRIRKVNADGVISSVAGSVAPAVAVPLAARGRGTP